VARDREQYGGVHTRHGIGACRTQPILVKRRAVSMVVARDTELVRVGQRRDSDLV
jgi:hypothetical protein